MSLVPYVSRFMLVGSRTSSRESVKRSLPLVNEKQIIGERGGDVLLSSTSLGIARKNPAKEISREVSIPQKQKNQQF